MCSCAPVQCRQHSHTTMHTRITKTKSQNKDRIQAVVNNWLQYVYAIDGYEGRQSARNDLLLSPCDVKMKWKKTSRFFVNFNRSFDNNCDDWWRTCNITIAVLQTQKLDPRTIFPFSCFPTTSSVRKRDRADRISFLEMGKFKTIALYYAGATWHFGSCTMHEKST